MRFVIAWRGLMHERSQSILAILGIFIAVLLIFLQLGFFTSVPRGGMLVYDALDFDIMLTSGTYVSQARAQDFPRRRIFQAMAVDGVERVVPFYQGSGTWRNAEQRSRREVFVMAFDLADRAFDVAEIERQQPLLREPDSILLDMSSRPAFGPASAGGHAEINDRAVTIVGSYPLGTGFLALGVAIASDQNFARMFPERRLEQVNLGLVRVQAGRDVVQVAHELRSALPPDTQVMTRQQLTDHEVAHWMTRTSTGIVWGFGLTISFVVGAAILFQTLSTQVRRHLSKYAVAKAMGYTNGYLGSIVVLQAVIISIMAFGPAVLAALEIYEVTREATRLPIVMTAERVVLVWVAALAMAVGSALLALRVLRRADPVELF
jgi:putative ABC transport system permease protein